MQISIAMLSQTGGHADDWLPVRVTVPLSAALPGPARPASSTGRTRCAARSASCIRDGADVIKVATSGGVLSPRDNPPHAHFSPGSSTSSSRRRPPPGSS